MPRSCQVQYHGLLLSSIRTGQNEQFKMLDDNVIQNTNEWKTLLHHSAFYNNEVITQYLIDMGAEVDALDSDSRTPLMIAVEERHEAVAKVLLKANASIDFVDGNGVSILQMVLDLDYHGTEILTPVLQRLRCDSSTIEELVAKLIDAGGSMHHATFLKDIQVMEALIERGIDVNSRGHWNQSALHAAVDTNDFNLAMWIIDKGGEIDAFDEFGKSPLFNAASSGIVDMVRLLLEHGANPNTRQTLGEYTSLFAAFAFSPNEPNQENFDECVELLLQHGAIPENSSVDNNTIFDYALLNHVPNNKINYLLGQLAILDRLGKLNVKSIMRCNVDDHRSILSQLENFYESCMKLLEFRVHGNLSLFDLLTHADNKMRIHLRNKTLISKLDFIYPMLNKIYPYYYRMLRKRICKAVERVNLEDTAISALSNFFNGNYNLCYNFARQLIGYLGENDLEQLGQI